MKEATRKYLRFMGWWGMLGGALRLGIIIGVWFMQHYASEVPVVSWRSLGIYSATFTLACGVYLLWTTRVKKPSRLGVVEGKVA